MSATTFDRQPLRRCRHGAPCPVCGRADWCSVSADNAIALCMRVASDRPTANGGWTHRLAAPDDARRRVAPPNVAGVALAKLSTAELTLIDRQCRADLTPARLDALASRLCVSPASLQSFGVGWHHDRQCLTFAMRDADARIVGIRTRHDDGAKRCLAGSRLGLFVADAGDASIVVPDWLLVCEGESDAAAARDLGFCAIGRPGCAACGATIVAHVRRLKPERVAIVADSDAPGQRGGHALARAIATEAGIRSRVLTLPGAKDVRAWKALPESSHHALLALLDAPAARRTSAGVQAVTPACDSTLATWRYET